jgi:hypothetical protein
MAFAWARGDTFGLPPTDWVVHSQNPVGSANMTRALQNADRFWTEPFEEKTSAGV